MDFLVRFSPARPCSELHCIAMTNIGMAELQKNGSFITYPYCPRHCYFVPLKPSQKQEGWDSIANFVLSELGEQVKVLEITRITSDEVRKHDIEACKNDDVWCVAYQPVEGDNNSICYVVWLDLEAEFCLRRKGH